MQAIDLLCVGELDSARDLTIIKRNLTIMNRRMPVKRPITIAIAVLAIAPAALWATIIDFETIPGDVPAEGLVISNQFEASHGVTFSLQGGGSPVLAQVGSPATAFRGPGNLPDTPAEGQGIGQFFLTDDGVLAGLEADPLIVTYSTPTAAASGVIVDIDFDESFLVEAFDAGDILVDSFLINAGDDGTGDGIATLWFVEHTADEIAWIRFTGTRTEAGVFGLAFDNFSARSVVPLPATVLLLASGFGLLGFAYRGRSQQ